MSTINTINRNTQLVNESLERLSSGKQINRAADDAAGLAISEGFSTQSRGQLQAIRNAGDGISLLQTAEGAVSTLVENAQRIRELSVQAANGSYTDDDRALIEQEVRSLREQMNDTLNNSQFNGQKLFGADQQVFQVGPDAGNTLIYDSSDLQARLQEAGLNDLSVNSQDSASETLSAVDEVLGILTSARAENGALQNRFESVVETLEQSNIDANASRSRITDTDYAQQISELSQAQIREQISIAVQGQANQQAGRVLQLLQ